MALRCWVAVRQEVAVLRGAPAVLLRVQRVKVPAERRVLSSEAERIAVRVDVPAPDSCIGNVCIAAPYNIYAIFTYKYHIYVYGAARYLHTNYTHTHTHTHIT